MNQLAERVRWITHRGQQVLVHNYADLANEEYTDSINRRVAEIRDAGTRDILLLLDVTDSYIDRDTLSTFRQAGKDVRPYVRKLAVIGVSGVQRYFLHLINQFSKIGAEPFETEQEAIDWLTR